MGVTTRAKKSLTRDSDIDASLRLIDGVRNSPTVRTPTVPTPNPASNEDADVAIRRYLQEQGNLTDDIYKTRLHRAWAKSIREDVLGDKKHHFRGTDDAGLLSDLVVQLRTEFESARLELKSFDIDNPLAMVVRRVNGLLYDVLALVVEKHSNAYVWLTGTDASSDRDGRRALIDIIKGCVPVALRESQQEEHAALRYPANVDPQPILAREQRLVRDNKASDWTPTEATRKLSMYTRLDPTFYAAVKSAHVALAAADKTRGNAVLQSSRDIDVVKRVAKDTLGTKASSFSGSEPHRQLLWDSLVTALEASFVNKDSANEDIFDLVDVNKEVHPIFNDILLRALVSLTTPHSPARRWVDASARISPRDGKRALLEITKRLLPPGHRPLRHHEELLSISFGSADDPEPLVAQFDECLKAIAASGALDDTAAKRQLLAALDGEFYRDVITPLRLDTELAKVGIEEIYTHVLEVWWCANPDGPPTRPKAHASIPAHTPLAAAYAGGSQRDMKDFLEEFARIVGEASTLLASLRHEEHGDGRDTPIPRDEFPRRHGAGGVKFPPSKWRDDRNRRPDVTPDILALQYISQASLRSMVVEIYQAWAQTDAGKADSGAGGISAHLSSSEYDALLAKITELKEMVQRQHGEGAPVVRQQRVQQRQQQQQRAQQPRGFRVGQHKAPPVGFDRDDQRRNGRSRSAAGARRRAKATDDGAEAFARAAAAYGPPAVLCAGAVGGIDVSAYGFAVEQQSPPGEPVGDDILRRLDDLAAEVHSAANHQVHFTHTFFPPPDGIEQQTSALVCGPAATGITPEEQVPVGGGAAALASAVPAPAMPVSQEKDVEPVPLQSARVTTTAATDGEFAGFVQTVNHAAIAQVDLTGYDTEDYEDLADGSFVVKPRAPAISANHASESTAHAPRSGGASRTYGCGKPPWGFPAHAGTWGMPCWKQQLRQWGPAADGETTDH
ncbi:hypothetical protein CYMTET_52176 [Cymbomonas tetramitiformis]|uniref:Uncharacterized protein n=1 Tax=Cymbomonas tetramitiformis TaxID=36881 RepID=A0AAE0ET05_9CHLO|nr:hypothetical protein CYMTET_52176 [Cymbomonas tetramitiformis]